MIFRICFLLEALSVVICLHYLYGEKFRLDIKTTVFLAIDMILMSIIQYYGWPQTVSVLIYPIIIGYCSVKFGFHVKEIIVNNVLYMIIVSLIQCMIICIVYILKRR